MVFVLDTAREEYASGEKPKYEKLGFTFTKKEYPKGEWLDGKPYCWVISKSQIEINTMEELIALCKQTGGDIVVGFELEESSPRLTIYDGYLE